MRVFELGWRRRCSAAAVCAWEFARRVRLQGAAAARAWELGRWCRCRALLLRALGSLGVGPVPRLCVVEGLGVAGRCCAEPLEGTAVCTLDLGHVAARALEPARWCCCRVCASSRFGAWCCKAPLKGPLLRCVFGHLGGAAARRLRWRRWRAPQSAAAVCCPQTPFVIWGLRWHILFEPLPLFQKQGFDI